jgi:hypothetical protein
VYEFFANAFDVNTIEAIEINIEEPTVDQVFKTRNAAQGELVSSHCNRFHLLSLSPKYRKGPFVCISSG